MSAPELAGEARGLAAEAADCRLLALLFSRPRPGWHEEVAALAAEVRDPELRQAAAEAEGAAEGPYHALLGPGGAVSPREVGHRGRADPGRLLAELRTHYQAFGFEPRAEEAADHVALEVDFLAYLWLKEAFALARGDGEAALVTRQARERFAREHVAPMARGIARGLAPFKGHAARAARALLARLGGLGGEEPTAGEDPLEGGCPLAGQGCEPSAG